EADEAVGMRLVRGAGAVVPSCRQLRLHRRLGEIEHGRGQRQRMQLHAARVHVGEAEREVVELLLVMLLADEEAAIVRFAVAVVVLLAVLTEDVEIALREIMGVDVDGAGIAGRRRERAARRNGGGAGSSDSADCGGSQPALQDMAARHRVPAAAILMHGFPSRFRRTFWSLARSLAGLRR